MARRRERREFGQIRRLPSKRFQARYRQGTAGHFVNAPTTFANRVDAQDWLARERVRLEQQDAGSPRATYIPPPTFGDFTARWLDLPRKNGQPLRPSTRRTYDHYLHHHILPAFGGERLDRITADQVEAWHADLLLHRPSLRAHVYSLLRTILNAATPRHITVNPAQVPGAGQHSTRGRIEPLDVEQVNSLADAMPDRLRLTVLLGAWCQVRQGECLELRRRDVDMKNAVIKIRRGVTWTEGQPNVGPPKTGAGVRDINVPPHILDDIQAHLDDHANPGRDGLLFPGTPGGNRQMHPSTFASFHFDEARKKIGLPTVRFHHLRHTGASLAAQSGATVAELQARLGHLTPHTAMLYQHAVAVRDKALAESLSRLAGGSNDD